MITEIKKIAKEGEKYGVESFDLMCDEGVLIMVAEFGEYKEPIYENNITENEYIALCNKIRSYHIDRDYKVYPEVI